MARKTRAEQTTLAGQELATDPKGLGYAPYVSARNHGQLVIMTNDPALSGDTCDVEGILSIRLQEAVIDVDWVALKQADAARDEKRLDLWRDILVAGVQGINIRDPQIRQQVGHVWQGFPNTINNLLALQTGPCSRAQVVTGHPTYWDHILIAEAIKEAAL